MAQASSSDLTRVQKVSAVCAVICGVAAIGLPVLGVAQWALNTPTTPEIPVFGGNSTFTGEMHRLGDPAFYFPEGIKPWQRINGALVSLIPDLILSWGLLRARAALAAFARGEFFAVAVGTGLRAYAAAMFWALAAHAALQPVLSAAVTFANPAGHRVISVGLGFSTDEFFRLMSAGILWVIAAGMVRASAIARENEQFV